MNLKTIRNIILLIILVTLSLSAGYWLGEHQAAIRFNKFTPALIINKEPPPVKEIDFSLFWDVWSRLEESYIDKGKLIPEQMVYGAISGMVASLGDPYTVFLPPKEQKEAKEELGGTFEGIGAELGMKDKKIIVVAPLKDTPAERAGIKKGDWIIKIDGEQTFGWTVPQAVNKIRGKGGTTVVLTVLHEGEQDPVDISIVRDKILVKSVEYELTYWQKDDNRFKKDDQCTSCPALAVLRLMRFGDQTNKEWNDAVSQIAKKLVDGSIKGVVLDLRNNPGGYLQGAVFIVSEFLERGLVVVQQEYSSGKKETYSVVRGGNLLKTPLVVLINKGSASASEIVAGALRDYHRAKLIGEKTFGKGSIQEAQELPGGAGLHITVARWLLPKGEWINSKGVNPDIEVELDEKKPDVDNQLEEAANTLFQNLL